MGCEARMTEPDKRCNCWPWDGVHAVDCQRSSTAEPPAFNRNDAGSSPVAGTTFGIQVIELQSNWKEFAERHPEAAQKITE